MNNHVFVSYSHEDLTAAELLVKALEERDVVCWLAPRDVPAGGSYAESILNAIESASCFVLIYSKNSNVSSHVMREVERALKFGVNIVPVRFDDSTPSKSLDYLLATVHWLAIAPDSRDRSIVKAAEQILAAVAKSRRTSPQGEPDRVPTSRTVAAPVASPPKRYSVWIGAAVVLALVAGLIGFFISRHPSQTQSAQKSAVATSPTAAPSATTAAATKMDESELPVAITHRYFDLLKKRNAIAAFNLLSVDFRNHLSSEIYSKKVSATPRANLVQATLVSMHELTASVMAVLEDANPESHQPQWRAPIEFVLEPAGWRIDSMKGLLPATGRPILNPANGSDGKTQDTDQPASQPANTPSPTLLPTQSKQAMYGIVRGSGGIAQVYREPFMRAKIVTVLKNGKRVEIDRLEGGWAHVILGPNQSGYIQQSRLNIIPGRQ